MMQKIKINYWKLGFSLLLFWYFISYVSSEPVKSSWHFIDAVDLIIHEAGHFIFMFGGQFVSILGGSLLQISVPAIFVAYFMLRREYFSGSVILFWLGQSLVSVSVYMADAIVQELPLLGGEAVIHDFAYLFSVTGLIGYTADIANSFFAIGTIIIIGAGIACVGQSVLDRPESPKSGIIRA